MKKNTGIPYESLTQQIFNEILNQNVVETINVEHNVILPGKHTKHQIDVYWKFLIGGITYSTVIQAKDWSSKVKQEQLLAFKSILDDLPGQPKGIFVTRTGYQKGAFEYAKSHGILLYELREPLDSDWEGSIRDVIISMNSYYPISKETKFNFDLEWAKEEKTRLNIPEEKSISINISGPSNEIELFNDRHEPYATVDKIIKSLYPSVLDEIQPIYKEHVFKVSTFVLTGNTLLPFIKLKSIGSIISVSKNESEIRVEGNKIIGYILKDVINGIEKRFDKSIKLLGKTNDSNLT